MNAIKNSPVAKIIIPIPPRMPACRCSTSLPAMGATSIIANGHGVRRNPICALSYPSVFWKKKGSETMASIWAVKEQEEVRMDSEKIGIRIRPTGSKGCC